MNPEALQYYYVLRSNNASMTIDDINWQLDKRIQRFSLNVTSGTVEVNIFFGDLTLPNQQIIVSAGESLCLTPDGAGLNHFDVTIDGAAGTWIIEAWAKV